MSYPLFITTNDIPKFTALNGNTDVDKFVQFCLIAQDIHIQNYLGTNLYEKISNDITAGTLAGNYLSLVNNHIKKMLIHFAMVEYLPFAAYTIANKGVYKHGTENGETVDKNEVDYLVEKERQIAEHYTERFIRYICENSSLFPEYNNNTGEDMQPDQKAFTSGWVLDDGKTEYVRGYNKRDVAI
ncbi:MAG: hypothetical protein Unbinned3907contig1000_14 [Prokaryotic dsDNA virus sp.]|nr:MAG: hypothetical protein Unbinned3907contig1000_14 [Prokaryotic dsDNA virus sp.]|tara:strand:- start:1575 stop:2129 length:555 start_codon:yes stop_codon:yes gene_type:complete